MIGCAILVRMLRPVAEGACLEAAELAGEDTAVDFDIVVLEQVVWHTIRLGDTAGFAACLASLLLAIAELRVIPRRCQW